METNILREKIIEIISINRGKSNLEFNDSTSLMNDLGIDGDDALEILDQYFNTFTIDKSKFNFEDYFGYEGFYFFKTIKAIIFGNRLKNLTIGDLVNYAESGEWGKRI